MKFAAAKSDETRDVGGVPVPVTLLRQWGWQPDGRTAEVFREGYDSAPADLSPYGAGQQFYRGAWRRGRMVRWGVARWTGPAMIDSVPPESPERGWYAAGAVVITAKSGRLSITALSGSDERVWTVRGYNDAMRAPHAEKRLIDAEKAKQKGADARRRGQPRNPPKGWISKLWLSGWDGEKTLEYQRSLRRSE